MTVITAILNGQVMDVVRVGDLARFWSANVECTTCAFRDECLAGNGPVAEGETIDRTCAQVVEEAIKRGRT